MPSGSGVDEPYMFPRPPCTTRPAILSAMPNAAAPPALGPVGGGGAFSNRRARLSRRSDSSVTPWWVTPYEAGVEGTNALRRGAWVSWSAPSHTTGGRLTSASWVGSACENQRDGSAQGARRAVARAEAGRERTLRV